MKNLIYHFNEAIDNAIHYVWARWKTYKFLRQFPHYTFDVVFGFFMSDFHKSSRQIRRQYRKLSEDLGLVKRYDKNYIKSLLK